jgi:hypothetical protein
MPVLAEQERQPAERRQPMLDVLGVVGIALVGHRPGLSAEQAG